MKILLSLILSVFIYCPAFAAAETQELNVNSRSLEILSDQYYSYNFGNVRVNWSEYADFYLRNTGTTPLEIRGVYIYGTSYWAWSNCPRILGPNQRCLSRVEFRPWSEGSYFGRLRFKFNDGNIFINLYGWGTRF